MKLNSRSVRESLARAQTSQQPSAWRVTFPRRWLRLPAADSETQYINFPFSADCDKGGEQCDAVDGGALQQLLNKYELKLS